jgi:putative pyrroloquinoline-quinone binding quinoprotein
VFRVRYLIAIGGAAVLAAALAPFAHAAPKPAPKPAAKYDWPQFAYDPGKSANDTAESTVNLGNVKNLKQLFKVALKDAPDGSPVYLHDVSTPKGVKDVVYVQGEHGHLIAMDGHTGATIWSDNFGPGGISNSSPAIEPSRKFIYINANDGKVHKVNVGDGTEVKSGGWPVSTGGGGKSSSALTIATAKNGHTYLYAANQGHARVTTIDLANASKHIFSLACSNHPDSTAGCGVSGANPWARGPAFDASLDVLYQMGGTNNGSNFVPGQVWRNSWVAIPADGHTIMKGGKGYPVDSYTPKNWSALVKSDQDIGSGGMLILPTTLSRKYPHLGVQPGKDKAIRLINLANMSGKGAPGNTGGELQLFPFPQMANMRSQGAVWTNPADKSVWVFITGHGGVGGFQVTVDTAGNPKLVLKWFLGTGWTSSAFVANGVLYAANGAGEHTTTQKLHQVQAINPTTGKVVWTGAIGLHHWSSPIIANGIVYMVDGNSGGFGSGTSGNLIAWALP